MFCRTCGKELDDQAIACTGCGVPPKKGKAFCQNCGKPTHEAAEMCVSCGVRLASGGGGVRLGGGIAQGTGTFTLPKFDAASAVSTGPKQRMIAGLLAILGVGCFGLHRFYLGDNKNGIIMAAVSVVGLFMMGIPTIAMGAWAIYDAYRIFTNQINEDFFGNPLE